jgi:hypothetical protein
MHGGDENCFQNLVGEPEKRRLLRDLSIDGKIKLNWILMK